MEMYIIQIIAKYKIKESKKRNRKRNHESFSASVRHAQMI